MKQKRTKEIQQGQVNVLQVSKKGSDEGGLGKLVSPMCRGRDGEPLPKHRHVEAEDAETTRRMNIDNLINKGPLLRKVNKVSRKKKTAKKRSARQLAAAKTLTERVDHYDLLSSLA